MSDTRNSGLRDDAGDTQARSWLSRSGHPSPSAASGQLTTFVIPDDRDEVFALMRELAELAVRTGNLSID